MRMRIEMRMNIQQCAAAAAAVTVMVAVVVMVVVVVTAAAAAAAALTFPCWICSYHSGCQTVFVFLTDGVNSGADPTGHFILMMCYICV